MSRDAPTPIVCPRCGGTVGADQAWCLTCGAPARTRMRPTPNWRIPIAVIAAIVLAVAGGTVGAFVALTTDDEAAPTATQTAGQQAPPAAQTPPATQAPPASQAPPAATPAPTATAPAGTATLPPSVTAPAPAATPAPAPDAAAPDQP